MVALTHRQERFCQQYAFHGVGRWAAQEAGYAHQSARQRAHKLLSRGPVRARIAELRARIATAECGEREALLAKLQYAYEVAMIGSNPSAAIRALALQAKLSGLEPARPRPPVERTPVERWPVSRAPIPPAPAADAAMPVRLPRSDTALAALFPEPMSAAFRAGPMKMHRQAETAARAAGPGGGG